MNAINPEKLRVLVGIWLVVGVGAVITRITQTPQTATSVPSATEPTDGPTPEASVPQQQIISATTSVPAVREPQSSGNLNEQARKIILDEQNARSIWSTSVFSYAPAGGGPGGGQADYRLRVGGWGDVYVTLLQFDLNDRRTAKSAYLTFHVLNDEHPDSTPTPMILKVITAPWNWTPGDRLWWRDLPQTVDIRTIPAPSSSDTSYVIDITDIYNDWISGKRENYGIMLSPQFNNNRFNNFDSTRGPENARPKLEVTYQVL